MKELIESLKKLQGGIISKLIHARTYHDRIEYEGAVSDMESLMTATMQQLQCVIDALEGISGTVEWQTGEPKGVKYYLVQIRCLEGHSFVIDHWNGSYWQLYEGVVTAWSELSNIKPYKEKEETE